MLVLRAGALFDGEVRRSGADLLVEGGRVVAVEDSAPAPADAELVDLGPGVTLLPGLVDAHQHLVMDARLSGELQRALEKIPERQRTALLLAELHDLTGLELAAAMGVSHVAARAILTRARESLRRALAAEQDAERAAEIERDSHYGPQARSQR